MTLATTELLATAATLSLRFFTTYVGGYAIWLLYGLSIQRAPIGPGNSL